MTTKFPRGLLAVLLGTAVLPWSPSALAQSTADKAAAEALFQAGRDLMTSGRFAEACPKFEASNRLDAGLGTLLFLAECYEKAGRTASAWATFREAESIAMGRSDQMRAQVARDRAAALEPRLSKLWIKVDPGNDPGLTVTRDGEAVPRESWGLALPTDPGEHVIQASAPGREGWSSRIVVSGEAMNVPVDIPVLTAAAPAAAPAPPTAPAPATTLPAPGADASSGAPSSTQKTLGIVFGAVGVASLGVGTYFGLHAKAKKNDSLNDCRDDNPNLCGPDGVELRNQALSSARLGTAFMIGGGAFLAGGIVLYLTAPKAASPVSGNAAPPEHTDTGVRVGVGARPLPGGAHLSLQGAF